MITNPNLLRKPDYKKDYGRLIAEIERLSPEQQKQRYRWLCRNDMYFLLKYACGIPARIMDIPFIVDRCSIADERIQSPEGLNNWLIMVFREGGKSLIFNYGAIIQYMLRYLEEYPDLAICIFSYNKTKAEEHLDAIKKTLESSDQLKDWFDDLFYANPKYESDKWSTEKGINVKTRAKISRKEPTLYASGLVEGMPTGMHFNLRIYDDVVTDKSVKTYHQMETTTAQFRLSDNLKVSEVAGMSQMWILGTFYKHGDTYCQIINDGIYKHEKVQWIDEAGNYRYHTNEEAEAKKIIQGRYNIACQQMLEPMLAHDRKLFWEWITKHMYSPPQVNFNQLKTYLLVDPATKKKESRGHDPDFTAMWVLGKDTDGQEYFIDGAYDRLTRPKAVELAFKFIKRYNIREVHWEEVGAQEDQHWIDKEKKRAGIKFAFKTFSPSTEKTARIEGALAGVLEFGQLRFPPECYYNSNYASRIDLIGYVLKTEIETFPEGHDDFLDCGSMRTQTSSYGRPCVGTSQPEGKSRYEYGTDGALTVHLRDKETNRGARKLLKSRGMKSSYL